MFWGLGFGVEDLGFRVLGFRVQGLGLRAIGISRDYTGSEMEPKPQSPKS